MVPRIYDNAHDGGKVDTSEHSLTKLPWMATGARMSRFARWRRRHARRSAVPSVGKLCKHTHTSAYIGRICSSKRVCIGMAKGQVAGTALLDGWRDMIESLRIVSRVSADTEGE